MSVLTSHQGALPGSAGIAQHECTRTHTTKKDAHQCGFFLLFVSCLSRREVAVQHLGNRVGRDWAFSFCPVFEQLPRSYFLFWM